MKTDFTPYPVGTVHNPIRLGKRFRPVYKKVEILFPSRLNAMAIDPSKITANRNLVYTPGEVVFSIQIFKKIMVANNNLGKIIITRNSKRPTLILHTALIMQNLLKDSSGMMIEVNNQDEIRHAGLGSSSGLIAGVAAAINEFYGNPISPRQLIKYVAQNHGEEIDGNNRELNPVQCIGGSAVSGMLNGGLFVITGESEVITSMKIPKKKKVVLGIPSDFRDSDSKEQFDKEKNNLDKFLKTGKKFGPTIAYRFLHYAIPGMMVGDLKPLSDLIYEYRFKMGSIKNCSYVYPPMVPIAKKLAFLKEEGLAEVLSISSVGPTFFAITENSKKVRDVFKSNGLRTIETSISNKKYRVLVKE